MRDTLIPVRCKRLFVSPTEGLGRAPQRSFDSRRKLDKNEPSCGIKVIFTAFIDDAKVTIATSIFIGNNAIDFM